MRSGPWKAERGSVRDFGCWVVREWRDGEWETIAACPCADDATDIAVTLNRVEWGEPYPNLPGERGRAA